MPVLTTVATALGVPSGTIREHRPGELLLETATSACCPRWRIASPTG